MTEFLASLAAFAGLLAGRLARQDDFIEWYGVAEEAIEAGGQFARAWKERVR
jgi:hypothetical protein